MSEALPPHESELLNPEKPIDASRIRLMTVGLSVYQHIQGLNEAAHDASKFRALWDRTIRGIPSTYKVGDLDADLHLTDKNATKNNMLYGLDQVFGTRDKPAKDEDVSILYFSGHGTVLDGLTTHETEHDPDYEPKGNDRRPPLQKTTLPFREIIDRLKACKAGISLVFIDACYSGQALDDVLPLYPTGYREKVINPDKKDVNGVNPDDVRVKVFDHVAARSKGMDDPLKGFTGKAKMIMTASQPNQPAYELRGLGGLFTMALIQALTSNGTQPVKLLQSLLTLSETMAKIIAKTGLTQEPQICTSQNMLSLGTLPPFK